MTALELGLHDAATMMKWQDATGTILVTPNALVVEGNPAIELYQAAFGGLTAAYERAGFYIGDLLLACERQYGESYAQVAEQFNYSRGTLYNFTYVAKAIPPERRRLQHLDFAHHQIVASLPPAQADELLERAESEEWSAKKLALERDVLQGKPRGMTLRETLEHLIDYWETEASITPDEESAITLMRVAEELRQIISKYRF